MPKIDLDKAPVFTGVCNYPAPYSEGADRYTATVLGDQIGLTQFGVGIETLHPGGLSSQRHWHENEDEFMYVLSGEVTLVEDDGPVTLRAGDAAGWAAGSPVGHHLQNRTDQDATYLIFGTRAKTDRAHYPDIDLAYIRDENGSRYEHKDGTPYPKKDTK
jgi:uncharacterized cupin superfamily protein